MYNSEWDTMSFISSTWNYFVLYDTHFIIISLSYNQHSLGNGNNDMKCNCTRGKCRRAFNWNPYLQVKIFINFLNGIGMWGDIHWNCRYIFNEFSIWFFFGPKNSFRIIICTIYKVLLYMYMYAHVWFGDGKHIWNIYYSHVVSLKMHCERKYYPFPALTRHIANLFLYYNTFFVHKFPCGKNRLTSAPWKGSISLWFFL